MAFGAGRRRHTVKRVKHQMRDMNGALGAVFASLKAAGFNIRSVLDLPDIVDDILEEIKDLRGGASGVEEAEGLLGLVEGTGAQVEETLPGFMGLGMPDEAPIAIQKMGLGAPDERSVQSVSGPPDPKTVQANLDAKLKSIEEKGVRYRSFGPRGRTTVTREEEIARTGAPSSAVLAQQVAAMGRRIPR